MKKICHIQGTDIFWVCADCCRSKQKCGSNEFSSGFVKRLLSLGGGTVLLFWKTSALSQHFYCLVSSFIPFIIITTISFVFSGVWSPNNFCIFQQISTTQLSKTFSSFRTCVLAFFIFQLLILLKNSDVHLHSMDFIYNTCVCVCVCVCGHHPTPLMVAVWCHLVQRGFPIPTDSSRTSLMLILTEFPISGFISPPLTLMCNYLMEVSEALPRWLPSLEATVLNSEWSRRWSHLINTGPVEWLIIHLPLTSPCCLRASISGLLLFTQCMTLDSARH